MLFEFKTTAHHVEKDWHDVVTEYIFAYDFAHAKQHIISRLNAAGWSVDDIEGRKLPFKDIRDHCDRVTF